MRSIDVKEKIKSIRKVPKIRHFFSYVEMMQDKSSGFSPFLEISPVSLGDTAHFDLLKAPDPM